MRIFIKICSGIHTFIRSFETVSLCILDLGLVACAASLTAAIAIPSFMEDPATAAYWSRECFYLAKEMLGATAVSALLFEDLLMLLQMKKNIPSSKP